MANRTRSTRPAALGGLAALTLLLAACGGGDGGDGGDVASARPPQAQIKVTSEDASVPFELQPGRYKFGWDASTCNSVAFTMTGASQGFTYEKTTRQKKFSAIVSDVPEDTYTLAQTDPACATWSVQIDKIGN